MASLNGFKSYIAGATGSQGVLGPEASWKVYVLPRGAHASQASTGAIITFDSANAAARFTALDWVQVGTNTSNIRQVSAVGGNSINVGTAISVAQNDRVFRIGTTQPTVSGGSATYQPHTTIYPRDDDGATPTTNSMLTTDANGGWEFFARDNFYDALIQDSNRSLQMGLVDIVVGVTSFTQYPVQTVFNVKDPRFGAIGGNNSAVDDRAAIQAALDAAAVDSNGAQSAIVYLPRDTYHIGSQLNVPRSTRVIGDGARNTFITAGDAWAGNSFMVFLGDNSTNSHQTRLEHLAINGNLKTMTGGVESVRAQEASGLFNCLVYNFTTAGASFGSACQNSSIISSEFAGSSSGEIGIRFDRVGVYLIQDVTVTSNSGEQSTEAAILMRGGNGLMQRIHVESHNVGIGITNSGAGSAGEHSIIQVTPHNSTASSYTVHINDTLTGSVHLINISRGAATTPIYDQGMGVSMNSAFIGVYNRNGIGSDDIVFSPETGAPANFLNPQAFRLGCSTTFDRMVGFSGGWQGTMLTGSAAGTLSMANRNTFILSTGASIHTLSNGISGQFAHFIGAAGAAVDFVRGSTLALTAALVGISQNMSISFRCMPNGVSWVQMHPVASNGAFA